jgi:hypothetical protein
VERPDRKRLGRLAVRGLAGVDPAPEELDLRLGSRPVAGEDEL